MIGVHKHQQSEQLFADTQPVRYSLRWPSRLGTDNHNPPSLTNLLTWAANTVNYWIYINDTVPTVQPADIRSFRIGGINIGYNAGSNSLFINECRWENVSSGWYSILYQNSQAGADTIIRVNDELPVERLTFLDTSKAWIYPQDNPTDSPTAYQPSALNQSIGNLTEAARNRWEIPVTPGTYRYHWYQPIIGYIRYSTAFLDLSHRNKYSARWTAHNQHGEIGRDVDGIWTRAYQGTPTRTVGSSTVTGPEGTRTVATHAYSFPTGPTFASRVVDVAADSDTSLPVYEYQGLQISQTWTPTDSRNFNFNFPRTA